MLITNDPSKKDQKLVAIIDVLGYTNLGRKYDSDEIYIPNDLKNTINFIVRYLKDNQPFKEIPCCPFITWKDCLSLIQLQYGLRIEAPINYETYGFYEQLNFFYQHLMLIQKELLFKGRFLKGSLTIEKSLTNEGVLPSKRFVNVPNSEQDNEVYPRITLSNKLIEELRKIESIKAKELDNMLVIDNSKEMFLNPFNYDLSGAQSEDKIISRCAIINNIGGIMLESVEDLFNQEKMRYLKESQKISSLEIVYTGDKRESSDKSSRVSRLQWLIDFIDFELKVSNKRNFKAYTSWRQSLI